MRTGQRYSCTSDVALPYDLRGQIISYIVRIFPTVRASQSDMLCRMSDGVFGIFFPRSFYLFIYAFPGPVYGGRRARRTTRCRTVGQRKTGGTMTRPERAFIRRDRLIASGNSFRTSTWAVHIFFYLFCPLFPINSCLSLCAHARVLSQKSRSRLGDVPLLVGTTSGFLSSAS